MANLGVLRSRVFTRLAERAGASFTEDEVDGFINDEYKYLQTLISTINEEYFLKRVTFASNASEKWALPSDFSKMILLEISVDGVWKAIDFVSLRRIEGFDQNPGSFLRIFENVSGHAYTLIDRCLVVKPNPGASSTQNIRLSYIPRLAQLAEDDDTPDPSIENYEELLVVGGVNRARQALKEPPIDVSQYTFLIGSLEDTMTPRVRKSPKQVRLSRGLY